MYHSLCAHSHSKGAQSSKHASQHTYMYTSLFICTIPQQKMLGHQNMHHNIYTSIHMYIYIYIHIIYVHIPTAKDSQSS